MFNITVIILQLVKLIRNLHGEAIWINGFEFFLKTIGGLLSIVMQFINEKVRNCVVERALRSPSQPYTLPFTSKACKHAVDRQGMVYLRE